MNFSKFWVLLMSILTVFYLVLLGSRGIILLADDSLIAKAMGAAILFFPVLAFWALYKEIRFGISAEKLSRQALNEGYPELMLELRPSGRAQPESAAEAFATAKARVGESDTDWRAWLRLGEAYEASGDRKRARAAVRQSIRLSADQAQAPKP